MLPPSLSPSIHMDICFPQPLGHTTAASQHTPLPPANPTAELSRQETFTEFALVLSSVPPNSNGRMLSTLPLL